MDTAQIMGLVTGILFGFLLQKGRVLRFEKQIGALLLEDMTILKFMLSAVMVGMVGIALLSGAGIITLSHKAMNVGGVVIGGALFGAGWAVMGFCPGTSVGALGEGRWHAVFAIAGMLAGGAIYAELSPFFKTTVLAWGDYGKIGLAETLGVSPWVVIVVFIGLVLALGAHALECCKYPFGVWREVRLAEVQVQGRQLDLQLQELRLRQTEQTSGRAEPPEAIRVDVG